MYIAHWEKRWLVRERQQRAREELRTAIQLSPSDADSHYDLGKMELERGKIRGGDSGA